MSKYKYSETERQINSVLKHQDEDLKSIHFPSLSEADATVAKADALLRRLGYQPDAIKGLVPVQPRKTMVIPTWEQCCAEAETHVEMCIRDRDKYIRPYRISADYTVNSIHIYEPCVLRTIAIPLLRDIAADSPHYRKARDLESRLMRFEPVSPELVPRNSMLREFLG